MVILFPGSFPLCYDDLALSPIHTAQFLSSRPPLNEDIINIYSIWGMAALARGTWLVCRGDIVWKGQSFQTRNGLDGNYITFCVQLVSKRDLEKAI